MCLACKTLYKLISISNPLQIAEVWVVCCLCGSSSCTKVIIIVKHKVVFPADLITGRCRQTSVSILWSTQLYSLLQQFACHIFGLPPPSFPTTTTTTDPLYEPPPPRNPAPRRRLKKGNRIQNASSEGQPSDLSFLLHVPHVENPWGQPQIVCPWNHDGPR